MRLAAKIALATLLLISQMGAGRAACLCAERPRPGPASAAPSTEHCPVPGGAGCAGCQAERDGAHKAAGPADSAAANPSECQISTPDATPSITAAVPPAVAEQFANLPPAEAIPAAIRLVPAAPQTHLVVPRIRAPGTEANGLRAPPLR
jgi:hypothetical protein